MGCKALVFPKQFKTQQYYNVLKQICPELENAQPGALKSKRWVCPGLREQGAAASLTRSVPRGLPLSPPSAIGPRQAPGSDHGHLAGRLSTGNPAAG